MPADLLLVLWLRWVQPVTDPVLWAGAEVAVVDLVARLGPVPVDELDAAEIEASHVRAHNAGEHFLDVFSDQRILRQALELGRLLGLVDGENAADCVPPP